MFSIKNRVPNRNVKKKEGEEDWFTLIFRKKIKKRKKRDYTFSNR